MEENAQIQFQSEFLSEITIVVVFEEDKNYEDLLPFFEQYGYGFMVPNKNLVIIDGEELEEENEYEILKFIEAHEISHIILGHNGPRNEKEELEADLGAYILLKSKNYEDSIKILESEFESRHGIEFSENLLQKVEKYFSN
jgi:hypothetical protein